MDEKTMGAASSRTEIAELASNLHDINAVLQELKTMVETTNALDSLLEGRRESHFDVKELSRSLAELTARELKAKLSATAD